MKKVQFILGLLLLTALSSQAQVSISVNFGAPPVWAPAERVEVQYYYLPDVDAYYDVPAARFIYIKNGHWFRSTSLPYRYRNYNLRGGNIVFLTDYRGNSPYLFHKNHKERYRHNDVVVVKKRKRENEGRRENEHEREGGEHRGRGKEKKHRD